MTDYAHELAESFINGNRSYVVDTLIDARSLALFHEVWRTIDNHNHETARQLVNMIANRERPNT